MSQRTEFRTTTMKGLNGWEADTLVDVGGGYVLRIFTMKRYGGELMTTATRMQKTTGDFLGLSHMPTEDFSEVVSRARVRVTQGAVKLQHGDALDEFRSIKVRMDAFYAAKEQEDALAV